MLFQLSAPLASPQSNQNLLLGVNSLWYLHYYECELMAALVLVKLADLIGVVERDLVDGTDGDVWLKNTRHKALAGRTIEFAQDLDIWTLT